MSLCHLFQAASDTMETKMEEHTRLYRSRFLMLFLFVTYSMASAFQWIEYSIISNILSKYYGVPEFDISYTSMVYMIFYIPLIVPANWILEKKGLRFAVLLGSFGTCLGRLWKRNMPGKRARRHFSQLSEFERGLIIGMKTAGWSTRRVAGQKDHSECAVRNCWEQWTREGTHARKTGSGATRKTTRREDRRIVQQALVDPTVTLSTIRADVGVEIVPQTISRYLAEANLKSKRPFRALPLTPEHRQLRLQWCQARSMWNVTDKQKVVFSDESRFVLGTDDNRVRVWRSPGEQYNSPHTVLHHTARTAGVMVWGAIAYDSRSTLIVMRGTLTGQRYVDDILRPHVGPFLNGLPGAIFQQDNARPHTARVAQDFLRPFQILP
ncbi:feline leukemia virus subgroup C receptor-related protein 1 [Trichonephila clavipes]|nr:feline leukemia virus subgroup C receptor-related protein 1 [Trichonephila clavipes]